MPLDGSTYIDEVRLCPDVNGPEIMWFAQEIEDSPHKLDMSTTYPNVRCGSAGCIIGFGKVIYCSTRVAITGCFAFADNLEARLGLTSAQANKLFYCESDGGPHFADVTKEIAVAALRHLAHTGEVRFNL